MYQNVAQILPVEAPSNEAAEAPLARLYSGLDLDAEAAETLFGELVAGRLSQPAISAMLIALRLKGEKAAELIGGARALRKADEPFERPDYLFADTCGTGGDGSGSINVSTAVAFVAAAAGLPVAKHGNRSVTSRCGSADVLEELGVKIDITAELSRRALDEAGVCFLFAPRYHPGLRHAGPVRRALKVRTIMNLLGPCVNPAQPQVQLLGVADPSMLQPIAETVAALGARSALIVHGAGLDEVALHGETEAIRVEQGHLSRITLSPEEAGLARAPAEALQGGGPEQNAARLKALLQGRGTQVETDVVALNAGALLMTAGLFGSLRAAVAEARSVILSGAGYDRLRKLAEISHA